MKGMRQAYGNQHPPQSSSRRGSEDTDSILDDGREVVCQEPMEEEEGGLTTKPKADKAKKRKHHYVGERVGVKDGTRYYDAEGYIPQYWPNPSRSPTENVVASAHSNVQPPSWDWTGYGAGLRSGHATNSKHNKNINVCLSGLDKELTISDRRQQEGGEGR